MGEDDFDAESPTVPGGVPLTDRMLLERAIFFVHKQLIGHMDNAREEIAKFYGTRMVPLELRVAQVERVAWLGLGVAATLLVLHL